MLLRRRGFGHPRGLRGGTAEGRRGQDEKEKKINLPRIRSVQEKQQAKSRRKAAKSRKQEAEREERIYKRNLQSENQEKSAALEQERAKRVDLEEEPEKVKQTLALSQKNSEVMEEVVDQLQTEFAST